VREATPDFLRTSGRVYRDVVARFREAGIETPELDARLLLSAATGIDDVRLIADPDVVIETGPLAKLKTLVEGRLAGKPVSRLIGTREFWGLDFTLSAATLDPRPDSETLVELVLANVADKNAALRVLDFGTGSGCLLLAMLSELSGAEGVGIDCSQEAVTMARQNAAKLGLDDRALFQTGNWGEGLEVPFDIIVSNPPYIPSADIESLSPEVREHDPERALDGGVDGLDAYRCVFPEMQRLLADDGIGVVEFGIGQFEDVGDIAQDAGLDVYGVATDLGGVQRVLMVKHAI